MTTFGVVMVISFKKGSEEKTVQVVAEVTSGLPDLPLLKTTQVHATVDYVHYHEQLAFNKNP